MDDDEEVEPEHVMEWWDAHSKSRDAEADFTTDALLKKIEELQLLLSRGGHSSVAAEIRWVVMQNASEWW